MVPQTEVTEIVQAWRALVGDELAEGWRTIPLAGGGPCRVLAGRHFPGNSEAILVGFRTMRLPPQDQLPQGRGFAVSRVDSGIDSGGRIWLALSRQPAGSLDMFSMMTEDVAETLNRLHRLDEDRALTILLARIRAWQEFMSRTTEAILSPEAEVGLAGELHILSEMLAAGVASDFAVDAWKGPLGGIHDFAFATGAVEVKSTVSPVGFPATIRTLEQLDDSLISPLFVAAVRLTVSESGRSLPQLVEGVRLSLNADSVAVAMLNSRLLHVGFHDAHSKKYTRRFSPSGIRFLVVTDTFPRFARSATDVRIRKARYEVDLDLGPHPLVAFEEALLQLGAI
jgi:hypothetical protein